MKIGLVCPYNITKGGGVQEVIRALHDGLEVLGHDAKIITPMPRNIGGLDTRDLLFLGVATDFRSPMSTTTQIAASVTTERIDQALSEEKFDILHFHEPWQPVLSRQVLSRSTSVNIATFHAKVPETLMSRTVVKVVTPYTKSVLKYLHELTAVSEAASEYISSMTDEPVKIIPNGIDLNYYKKAATLKKPPKKQKTILYIGRLEGRKGLRYLLRAFSLLSQENPEVRLVIAGDGPDRKKLEEKAEDLKLERVTFLGYVSEKDKLKLLAEADVFCSPAISGESFGIVLLEAMATGLVAVAGDNSGYVSLMQDLGAVSLVNPRDSVEFARRLHLLLSEPSLRGLWQKWAAKYVRQFDYPKIVQQYETFYQEALMRHKTRALK